MIGYILDTDHLSLYQRGHEPLQRYLFNLLPEQISMTIISAEELLRGRLAQIHRASTPEARVNTYYWFSRTLEFLKPFPILPYDTHAEAYFQHVLTQKIRIGVQDLKIAAITLSHNAILVTRNRTDFERIPALKIEDWS